MPFAGARRCQHDDFSFLASHGVAAAALLVSSCDGQGGCILAFTIERYLDAVLPLLPVIRSPSAVQMLAVTWFHPHFHLSF